MRKKYNKFSEKLSDEHGEYYIGYTNNNNTEFYIDADDFDKIKDYCWYDRIDNNIRRLCARIKNKKILMHVFLGFKNCDHEDRNELNNRKYNLRKCTHQENCQNRGMYSNNTSGITGVYWAKSLQKWTVRIQINGKNTNLGYFAKQGRCYYCKAKSREEVLWRFCTTKIFI